MDQIGVRRQPNGPLEQPDQLEPGQPGRDGQLVEAEVIRVTRMHQFDDPGGDGSACRCLFGPAAAAAMAPEQVAEGVDREFVRVHVVVVGFEHVVQTTEPVDQVRIVQHVPHEIRRRLHSEALAHRIDRRPRQIERAVAPLLAVVHPRRLAFLRIGDKQGRGADLLRDAPAGDFRAARLGNCDDKGVVGVRAELMRYEVRAQQTHANNALALPIGCTVSSIPARHFTQLRWSVQARLSS